jgi:hypothetical protein
LRTVAIALPASKTVEAALDGAAVPLVGPVEGVDPVDGTDADGPGDVPLDVLVVGLGTALGADDPEHAVTAASETTAKTHRADRMTTASVDQPFAAMSISGLPQCRSAACRNLLAV